MMAERVACYAIEQCCIANGHQCSQEDVNAYGNYRNTGWRKDYQKPGFQLYYAYRLFERRVSIAMKAFDMYLDDVSAGTTVVSIGCGPGPELAAAYGVLEGRVNNVRFLGIDSEPGWERLYQAWTNRVASRRDQFPWRTNKITNMEMLINLLNDWNASVVIFSYFMLDFGDFVNPSRLMEQVPSLQQVIIFDNPSIHWMVNDAPSSEATIYRDNYLIHRPFEDSGWERMDTVQVLVYSRYEMITTLGFAIKLRSHGHGGHELYLQAGHFKHVERSIASMHPFPTIVVPFTPIYFGINFREYFVNLVAQHLTAVFNISNASALAAVTKFSNSNCLDDYDEDDLENTDDCFKSDLIEDLLAMRSGGSMGFYHSF